MMRKQFLPLASGLLATLGPASAALAVCGAGNPLPQTTTYDDHVQPILQAGCVSCHGSAGGVSVASYGAMVASGDTTTAERVVDSTTGSSTPAMPLGADPLSAGDQTILCDWQADGFLENNSGAENLPPNGVIDTPAAEVTTISVGGSVDFTATATDPDGDLPLSHLWSFAQFMSGIPGVAAEDAGPITFSKIQFLTATYTATDSKGLADPEPDSRIINVISAVQERSVTVDLSGGTLVQRPGEPEDTYVSKTIGFSAVNLTPESNTLRLTVNFRIPTGRITPIAPQLLKIGALGTGSPRPETFASRLAGDCADGITACSHDFGPGMVISQASGNMAQGYSRMVSKVTLLGTQGSLAADFVSPYYEGPAGCLMNDSGNDACKVGPHFPDLVDGADVAAFQGFIVEFMFDFYDRDLIFSPPANIDLNSFTFNVLGGSLEIENTVIGFEPEAPGPEDTIKITVEDIWTSHCLPKDPSVDVQGKVIKILASPPDPLLCLAGPTDYKFIVSVGPLPEGDYQVEYRVGDAAGELRGSRSLRIVDESTVFGDQFEQ